MIEPAKIALAGVLALAVLPVSATAFPIAVGGEGASIFVTGTDPVIATYQGNSADFSNDLNLELVLGGIPGMDGNQGNDLFIFNNHANNVGDTVNLGTFAIGTELIFRLHVNNTGHDFFSGPASRNPDNLPHVRVQPDWMPNETLVSFEDLLGLPEYPGGFNDLSFSFTNTSTTSETPEPASATLLGLGLALAALGRRMRRR